MVVVVVVVSRRTMTFRVDWKTRWLAAVLLRPPKPIAFVVDDDPRGSGHAPRNEELPFRHHLLGGFG